MVKASSDGPDHPVLGHKLCWHPNIVILAENANDFSSCGTLEIIAGGGTIC